MWPNEIKCIVMKSRGISKIEMNIIYILADSLPEEIYSIRKAKSIALKKVNKQITYTEQLRTACTNSEKSLVA